MLTRQWVACPVLSCAGTGTHGTCGGWDMLCCGHAAPQNIAAFDMKLTAEEVARLEGAFGHVEGARYDAHLMAMGKDGASKQ